jgi:hypothetical protein
MPSQASLVFGISSQCFESTHFLVGFSELLIEHYFLQKNRISGQHEAVFFLWGAVVRHQNLPFDRGSPIFSHLQHKGK